MTTANFPKSILLLPSRFGLPHLPFVSKSPLSLYFCFSFHFISHSFVLRPCVCAYLPCPPRSPFCRPFNASFPSLRKSVVLLFRSRKEEEKKKKKEGPMRRRRRATGGKFHEIVSENITCCFIRNLFWVKKKLFSIVLITRNILSFLWNRPDCSLSDRGPESDIVRDSDSGRSLFLFFLSKVGCIPQTMISDNVQSPQKKKRGAVNACRNYLALLPKPKARRNGVVMGYRF